MPVFTLRSTRAMDATFRCTWPWCAGGEGTRRLRLAGAGRERMAMRFVLLGGRLNASSCATCVLRPDAEEMAAFRLPRLPGDAGGSR
jgi:hypothetical protein